jgi:hypothetical protein
MEEAGHANRAVQGEKKRAVLHVLNYDDLLQTVLPTRLPIERFYERFSRLFDHTIANTRPTFSMLRRAATLAPRGDLWCMKRFYDAVKRMRDPGAYLKPPARIRAPRRTAGIDVDAWRAGVLE